MLKAAGLKILVYTVNDPERTRNLAAWGVDAICTDRIDELTEELIACARINHNRLTRDANSHGFIALHLTSFANWRKANVFLSYATVA